MSTNGRIGIELKDGSILSVYHHWDSYPQWLGKTLNEHFNTRDKVAELIDGGDMSVCWTTDRWNPDFQYGDKGSTQILQTEEYGPQYYSQRGETCPPRLDDSLTEYIKNAPDTGSIEYVYVFNYNFNEWICYDINYGEGVATLKEIPA